jgi:hypothetical protein
VFTTSSLLICSHRTLISLHIHSFIHSFIVNRSIRVAPLCNAPQEFQTPEVGVATLSFFRYYLVPSGGELHHHLDALNCTCHTRWWRQARRHMSKGCLRPRIIQHDLPSDIVHLTIHNNPGIILGAMVSHLFLRERPNVNHLSARVSNICIAYRFLQEN